MIRFAVFLYTWLPLLNVMVWSGVLFWLAPRVRRLFTVKARRYDMLAFVLGLLIVNRLWYQGKIFVFGQHIEVVGVNEILWTNSAHIWAIVCAFSVVWVFRRYECTDARRC